MEEKVLISIVNSQREYFLSGKTLSYEFRKQMLKKLYSAVSEYKEQIQTALYNDLGKGEFESYMCEVGLTLSEISYMIKNLKKFMAKRKVKTPLAQFKSKSFTICSPYGNVLIMSPWNYPFLLTISPLCNALAAGNTAVVKPSAYSPNTSAVIGKIIEEVFPRGYVDVVTGGREGHARIARMREHLRLEAAQGDAARRGGRAGRAAHPGWRAQGPAHARRDGRRDEPSLLEDG